MSIELKARSLTWVLLAVGILVLPCMLDDCLPAHGSDRHAAPQAVRVFFDGHRAPAATASVGGLAVVAEDVSKPQVALMVPAGRLLVSVKHGQGVELQVPISAALRATEVSVAVRLVSGRAAHVAFSAGGSRQRTQLEPGGRSVLRVSLDGAGKPRVVRMVTTAGTGPAAVLWQALSAKDAEGKQVMVPWRVASASGGSGPRPAMATLHEPIERALIEWDWRMQDGIGTPREPVSFEDATEQLLRRGTALLMDLQNSVESFPAELAQQWQALHAQFRSLATAGGSEAQWESLWCRVHWMRRRIVFSNPLADVGPLVLVKWVPPSFSHQLTQYLGRHAQPGGGLFVLDRPGRSMRCRPLVGGDLPAGSFMQPDVSYDGRRILFAYCPVRQAPPPGLVGHPEQRYHLYEIAADGSHLRQLTDGPYDDFCPRYLPDGRVVFISTRRGGWHRCGGRPGQGCPNHTLALVSADGSDPHPISFHETQEWDPAVLHDGRIIYTRWDYVDRHAVYYEQLWTVRPDGSGAAIYFGNHTFNPVGIWEARPVPGSTKVMATAAAHHAMTAGSVILVDVRRGVDGVAAITRLTPDAPFPESETWIPPRRWHAPAGLTGPPPSPVEARRWPGHCYKSPYPLSEKYFLAAYSFDSLVGEPAACPPNMFGLYLVDVFGNKELIYRDLNLSSVWPVPLRSRRRPDRVQPPRQDVDRAEGLVLVQNVYNAQPPLPAGSIKRLRILQVLPKSTPGINWPAVGLPNASPGKQVLGTVPVEPDGSVFFRAPARIPLAFQVLDEKGRAVQVMRSVVYLQPGEVVACAGCHEPRRQAAPSPLVAAFSRPPSSIEPGPPGSKPFSYPLLVQPVLDHHCTACHNDRRAEGGIVLTGQPQGHYSVSYNALAPRVRYAAWGGRRGDFRKVNCEPLSQPGFFGARGSPLMQMLLRGHYDVALSQEDIERLATWMDANALFYGTFNRVDQARQQRGERIAGPDLQ